MNYFSIFLFLCYIYSYVNGFNFGVTGTKCSLKQSMYNDPCDSLYNAICNGVHCKCPLGTFEDKSLKRCRNGTSTSGSSKSKVSSDLDDLPFDYIPGSKFVPKKPFNNTTVLPQPGYPQTPISGYDNEPKKPNITGTYPRKPIIFPGDPTYGRNTPSGRHNNYPAEKPGYTGNFPDSSGRFPNQPGYNPKQPPVGMGSTPNAPLPNSIDQYGHSHEHRHKHNHMGQKTGGGIGGFLALVLFVSLIYFCCCRGEKGRIFRSKFPMGGRGGVIVNPPGVVNSNVHQPGQQVYLPQQPGQTLVYMPQQPGQQMYVPQQSGQIYVPQQPSQPYVPQQQPGQIYMPPQPGQMYAPQSQPQVIGFSSPPPPYSAEYKASAPPPTA